MYATHACGGAVYEVAQALRLRGVGRQVQRCSWKEDSFWTLTAIQPSLVCFLSLFLLVSYSNLVSRPPSDIILRQDNKHGSAWGLLTWKGVQNTTDTS